MLLNFRPLLRLLRKRLFLAFVFGCSLTYCIVNMLREKRSTAFVGHDYDEMSKNLDIDKVKMRLINIKRSQMLNPSGKAVKYGGDSKPHIPSVDGKPDGNQYQAGVDFNLTLKTGDNCRNSIQGKVLITDDRGYTCNRSDVTIGGCCPKNQSLSRLFSCETCQASGCCHVYEYCISCCMDPSKQSLLRKIIAKPGVGRLMFESATDPFEICLTKCRTSSESVHHENSYKDPNAKYCYGENPANTGVRIKNKEEDNIGHGQDFGT